MLVVVGIIVLAIVFTFVGSCTPEAEVMFYDAEDITATDAESTEGAGSVEESVDVESSEEPTITEPASSIPSKPPVTVTYAKGAGSAGKPKASATGSRSAYASQTYVSDEEQTDASEQERQNMVNDLMR